MATITGSGVLVGTAGNDTITGDTTDDVIVGHSGSDILNGREGDDILAPDTSVYLISDGFPFNAERYFGSSDDGAVDHADGGGGFDRIVLRFDGVTSGIAADFSDPSLVQTLAGSTVVNVEQFEMVLGSGSDDVVLGLGNDVVFAEAGNDRIDGRAGDDTLVGGDGTDVLSGGSGIDWLEGGNDADTLDGGEQDDSLFGQAGDDRLTGGGGTDLLEGDAGNDTAVLAGNLADYTFGISELGDGRLRLTNSVTGEVDDFNSIEQLEFADTTAAVADLVAIRIDGTDADDRLFGSYVADTINAGRGADLVVGFDGNDVLNGGAGDDTILAGGGNDTLKGGSGNDYLDGGGGDDIIKGGSGFDIAFLNFGSAAAGVNYTLRDGAIVTSNGTKTLTSIEGTDISGSEFADVFTGGSGFDFLFGDDGDDRLNGMGGNDVLLGHIGNDRLNGGNGNDRLDGGDGNDRLIGGNGSDLLDGGDGNDRLIGDGGGDTLTGGAGADRFVFTLASDSTPGAPDLIMDFIGKGNPGNAPGGVRDKIDLSAIDANIGLAGDQSFKLGQEFTGDAGQAYSSYDEGTDTTSLFLDVNGDAVADMTIQFLGQINLTRGDFIL